MLNTRAAAPTVDFSCSPLQHGGDSVSRVMKLLLAALIPGVLVSTWYFGIGLLINLLIAGVFALLFEGTALAVQKRNIGSAFNDYSAFVTAALFAIAIPPGIAWWIVVLGIFFAIIIVKHCYGGLGQNVFNPAMAGYLFLLLSFPNEMTSWHIPEGGVTANLAYMPLSFNAMLSNLQASFPFLASTDFSIDGLAKATPLIEYKMAAHSAILTARETGAAILSRQSETGWELVNFAYLSGGLFLLYKRLISWHIPVSIVSTIGIISLLCYSAGGAAIVGTPYLHLFGSATMIGAFFIATDPVSAATSNPAKLIYGCIIGLSIYSIRVWGSYLDSIAIAVLFGNLCAPTLDYFFRPKIYGHGISSDTQKHGEKIP